MPCAVASRSCSPALRGLPLLRLSRHDTGPLENEFAPYRQRAPQGRDRVQAGLRPQASRSQGHENPDVPTKTVLWGSVPYVMCMILALVILSIFPEIATWLPDYLMGAAVK